ncbi:MAG: hypothetical protein AAFZ07_09130 [Actinomycetota bacterium]
MVGAIGLLALGGCGSEPSPSTDSTASTQDCPVIGLPLPTPVAVTGGGTAATMLQQLSGLDLVEAELVQALPCSFSQLVVTPDQRGFVIHATELTAEERELAAEIGERAAPAWELRGFEVARAARPEVERTKQRLYAAIPIDVTMSLSSDQFGDVTVWVPTLPDQAVDDAFLSEVEDSVADVDADFAGRVIVRAQEPFVQGG